MITIAIFALLGGLFGWIYGGNLLGYIEKWFGKDWKDRANAADKALYYVAYGMAFSLLMPILSFWAAVVLGVSQWARRAVSWGPYIGCLIHGKIDTTKAGVEFINELLFADKDDYLKLRSCLALSVIGALGGAVLAAGLFVAYSIMGAAAPLAALWLPLALALKGPIYWACIEISGITNGQHEDGRNDGWGYAERAYNAYMWGLVAYILL